LNIEDNIKNLDLNIRTYNALRRAKIFQISQLFRMAEDDLLAISGLGTKGLAEIYTAKRAFFHKAASPYTCPVHNRFCDLHKCAIWDKDEHRCSLLSIAINTKRI